MRKNINSVEGKAVSDISLFIASFLMVEEETTTYR